MKLKSLSRLFALAVLLACFAAATEAPAQNMYGRDYGKGYGFGAGFDNCQQPFAPFAFGNFGCERALLRIEIRFLRLGTVLKEFN